MKIDGVPDGYELVRIGRAEYMDQYLGSYGDVNVWDKQQPSDYKTHIIVRKIERKKTYRPCEEARSSKPEWTVIQNATIMCDSSNAVTRIINGEYSLLLKSPKEARQLADWLNQYADWREAQDALQQVETK